MRDRPDEHNELDPTATADTVEFGAIEANPELQRVKIELRLGSGEKDGDLWIEPDFKHPIEINFGRTPETSPCYLVQGSECPQLRADYILVQPDVLAKDPRRGWVPIGSPAPENRGEGWAGDLVYIGRQDTPQLRLGPDVSRRHAYISAGFNDSGSYLDLTMDEIESHYARVRIHPDDIRPIGRPHTD